MAQVQERIYASGVPPLGKQPRSQEGLMQWSLDPGDGQRLAVTLNCGWTALMETTLRGLRVSHAHCPPPPWMDSEHTEEAGLLRTSLKQRGVWHGTLGVFCVSSSSPREPIIRLLDFAPDQAAGCRVPESSGDDEGVAFADLSRKQRRPAVHVQLGENGIYDALMTSIAAHPQMDELVAGKADGSIVGIGICAADNEA
ncbi:hypothetical protein CYMTET_44732 [Cymbomonas tetramitiformis]|uniref:Uncharacterized protein n=1 Tax=Cymbomonas tetramitiformis TaxID=36881 RepID=A0AAE0BZN5_9CHLO|nr:hypothetical protein CYMTET_44732 [Cymbomonas tetramitiformis]